MKNWLKLTLPGLVALLLGAILTLAFAPYDIFPLAVLAPAGLLALFLNKTPEQAFKLGFLFGLGFFSTGVYWIYISVHHFGNAPIWLSLIITGGFIATLALFPAAACAFTSRYFPITNTAKLVYAFPAIWVFSEWIRSWIATGFPWLLLGYSQTNSPLRGYAPLLSVYSISLALLICSGLLVNAVLHYQQKKFSSMYYNLFAMVCIWTLGGLLNLIPWTHANGQPLTVSLVQGNIPQSVKWSPDHLRLSFERYSDLSQPLWGKSNLIIWPEAAIPLSLQNAAPFIEEMDKKALDSKSTLILGIPIQNEEMTSYYNAVIALGDKKSLYMKRHLVPFGEYTPFAAQLTRLLDYVKIPMSNMVPGELRQTPMMFQHVKILTSICFEIAFPELMRTPDKTIGMLLTVTNDAWFGRSSAQAQHLQMGQMRAIELGRPVLFASNNGISAIINAKGIIEAAAPIDEAIVLTATAQPTYGLTPWMRNGLDPLLFILLCFLFVARRALRDETKHST